MPYYSKPKKNRSIRWFYLFIAVAAVGVLYWSYVMHPVSVEVLAAPQVLPPDGRSEAEIRVALINRLDVEVPIQKVTLKCEITQGAELVEIRYNEDATKAFIKAGSREGIVEVRVSSPELILPQTLTFYIESPRA